MHQIISRYLMSFGIVLLGGALIYFSYSIIYTVDRAPQIIADIDKASERIDRVLDEVRVVSDQIPVIVKQVDLIQEKIPLILAEVKENRLLVPDIINEVELVRLQVPVVLNEVGQVRQQIPLMLKEIKAVRQELPAVMNELEAYRKLVPDVLAEVAAVRESVPPTLDRAEKLAKEVRKAGQEASEGAVMGLFSGIIKLPFTMFENIGNKFKKVSLSDSDIRSIRDAAARALKGDVGSRHVWSNPDTRKSGEIEVISESEEDDRLCRELAITVKNKGKVLEKQSSDVCRNDVGEWELEL